MERQDVEFAAEGGVTLRGWLFIPDGPAPHPAITMAHGFAGVKEHGLEASPACSRPRDLWSLFTTTADSAPATERRASTSTRGCRSPTGAGRSPFSRAIRRSMPTGSDCGAAAMQAVTRSCSEPPTAGCAPWSPRYRPSAATSRACGASPLTWCPPWRRRSPTTSATSSTAHPRPRRRSSARTFRYPPHTGHPTRSRSTTSRLPRECGRTPSRCAPPAPLACTSRAPGSRGSRLLRC